VRQVIRPDTADAIKDALFQTIEANPGLKRILAIDGYTL
jgi:hypothetical protein